MEKKKLILLIGIIAFIVALITISVVYYNIKGNNEELMDEAVKIGITKVTSDTYEEEVLKSDKIVLVDFYENMCPPCTSMIPTLINISKSSEDIKVVMINVSDEENKKLIDKYEIRSTPTLYIVKDGEKQKEYIGATGEETLMSTINELMENKDEKKN